MSQVRVRVERPYCAAPFVLHLVNLTERSPVTFYIFILSSMVKIFYVAYTAFSTPDHGLGVHGRTSFYSSRCDILYSFNLPTPLLRPPPTKLVS